MDSSVAVLLLRHRISVVQSHVEPDRKHSQTMKNKPQAM